MKPLRHRLDTTLRQAALAIAIFALALNISALPTMTATELISRLRMEKIPGEGAWFTVTYNSTERIPAGGLPARYGASRLAGTAIYALITREDFSAMHRLKTDEVWHFYSGDPIELLLLHPDGRDELVLLGDDLATGQRPQFTVPAGIWMGARPQTATPAAYSLFGCTMAPGFDYADYEPGYRTELQKTFPARADLIAELTRTEFITAPAKEKPPAAAAVPSPTVFTPADMAAITVAPGVELRELIGRVGHARSTDYSVARFSLAPGKGTGTSYCKVGEEFFLVLSGTGTVVLGEKSAPVGPGSVVVIKPGVRHSLTAAAGEGLEFYAITFPAFSPEDYVRLPD